MSASKSRHWAAGTTIHAPFSTERYPSRDSCAGRLLANSLRDQVEVDSGAYYVEHEYPGAYLLKLTYGDSLECRIPVVIPQRGMRLDISMQQAQQCLGFPYHHPETGERGFILLFPSPSPSPE